jgi:hypothetical protein
MKKHLLIAMSLGISSSFAQQNWLTVGNNFTPPNQVTPTSNFLGSATGNNTWLRMGVNGNQDIFIDNLNGAPQLLPAQPGTTRPLGGHWVGLGRIFEPSTGPGANPNLAPKAHLHIHGGKTLLFLSC